MNRSDQELFDVALQVRDRYRTIPLWMIAASNNGSGTILERGLNFCQVIKRRDDLRPVSSSVLVGFEFSSETKEPFNGAPPVQLSSVGICLKDAVLEYEGNLIRRALEKCEGQVTRAAKLLGMTYQGLGYTISKRHPKLLSARSVVRMRRPARRKPATD